MWQRSCFILTGLIVTATLWAQTEPVSAQSVEDDHAGSALAHREIFQPGDRILFLGDQVTQQMTYTRAFAAAMLAMRPRDNLRFFNGGYDGATAAGALAWVEDLLAITGPQVVFVAMGINEFLPVPSTQEGQPPVPAPPLEEVRILFPAALAELVQRIRRHPGDPGDPGHSGVRRVILLGPSATQPGTAFRVDSAVINAQLQELSGWIREVAITQRTDYIDMTRFSRAVFEEAGRTEGEPLTFDGIRPNDLGGVVLASILLKGLGMEAAELEPLAWAPIAPRKMARVRGVLALPLRVPKLEEADRSRALYEVLLEHDQLFFRAWRVAGRSPSAGSRQEALARADQAWRKVLETAGELYPPNRPR